MESLFGALNGTTGGTALLPSSDRTVTRLPGRVLLGVFAKRPEPGFVKTRLCPPLEPQQAADLYRAFLEDTVERLDRHRGRWRRVGFDAGLAVVHAPDDPRGFFERLAPPGALLLSQGPGTLAFRLRRFFHDAFAMGSGCVLALGSDAPTLPMSRCLRALEALASGADAAIVPDAGGGYALLGLRRSSVPLVDAEAGPRGGVLARTLALARGEGLRTALLAPWYDVDVPSDLSRLARELRRRRALAPRTAAALDRLGLLAGR